MKYKVDFEIELKRNNYPGLYIALEGIDGCGKTTQVEMLTEYFEKQGRKVITTREPRKKGVFGDLVYKILLGHTKVPMASLQYLFTADRVANHHDVVIPALKKGNVVITDRCYWSAVVYGILDRTGGKYDTKDADLLLITQGILSMYHQFTAPDFCFYLNISVKESMKRLRAKKDTKEIYEKEDKIANLLTGYEYIRKMFPEEINLIEGEQEKEKVTAEIVKTISRITK